MLFVRVNLAANRSHMRLIAFFVMLIVSIGGSSIQAQEYVRAYLPGIYEDGDTISIGFDLANEGDPSFTTDKMLLECEYTGDFAIDSLSPFIIDLEESQLCADGQCTATLTVNHELGTLSLLLVRPDSIVVGTEGKLARIHGVGISVEDIIGRQGLPQSAARTFGYYPNPAQNYLWLSSGTDEPIGDVILIDINGRQVFQGIYNQSRAQIAVHHLQAGMYRIRLGSAMKTRPLVIR